jgi:hypothetical protein
MKTTDKTKEIYVEIKANDYGTPSIELEGAQIYAIHCPPNLKSNYLQVSGTRQGEDGGKQLEDVEGKPLRLPCSAGAMIEPGPEMTNLKDIMFITSAKQPERVYLRLVLGEPRPIAKKNAPAPEDPLIVAERKLLELVPKAVDNIDLVLGRGQTGREIDFQASVAVLAWFANRQK